MRFFLQPLFTSLLLMSGGKIFGLDIYRCTVPGSPPQFSQFPCSPVQRNRTDTVSPEASPRLVQERFSPGELQVVEIPALSSGERRSLEQAQRRAAGRQNNLRAMRARNAGALQRRRAMRADRCRTARQGLQQLADRKRKGYTLSDAQRLEQNERALKEEARVSC